MIERRGFLKLLGIGATTPLALYAEPLVLMPNLGEWVEDKGDFYIVRVPERKTFANETLYKPTIFLLGAGATVRQCDVRGFANLLMRPGTTFDGCSIDGAKMRTEQDRPALKVSGQGGLISHCTFAGPYKPYDPLKVFTEAPMLWMEATNEGRWDYYGTATV